MQNETSRRKLKPCASNFLKNLELKYLNREHELLALVWLVENFPNYVYATKIPVSIDDKFLIGALK